MSLNFNVDPYYDDFDPSKNYHRILFKPGYAVQARELTQAQTILQDQVTKFADHVFKQNTPVTGGQITSNLNCSYIKLQPSYNGAVVDVAQFEGKIIQSADGLIVAKVLKTVAATGSTALDDPATLIISYKSGTQFTESDVIYDASSSLAAQLATTSATGLSSIVSIAQGVFYISSNYTRADGIKISNGTFVQVDPQTVVISKYDNTPSARVGLNITESVQTFVSDATLLDPAVGASNYQAPGADRYKITLTLETRPLSLGDDEGFIELLRIENGQTVKLVEGTVYNVIDDYFAKRTYDTNGDYVVNDFKLTPKTNANTELYTMSVGKGVAYVHGYRLENQSDVNIDSRRARTTLTQENNPVFIDFGSYFYVDTVKGANNSFFDTTTYGTIDLHCVSSANINPANAATYSSTVVASANIRGMIYDSSTSDTLSNTYVYKAYVANMQNQTVSNTVVSATTNTITFPNYFSSANDAYVGVDISITAGVDAGDFRTITAYNGVTKTATVNTNWTVTPTSSSTFVLNFDTKDIESVVSATKSSYPASIIATARINSQGRVNNLSTGDAILQNPTVPEMLFTVGNPYASSLSGTSYTTQQEWRSVSFTASGGGYQATLPYTGDYSGVIRHFGTPSSALGNDLKKQNYQIIVTNAGTSSLNVGDNVPWTTSGRSITLDSTGATATLAATDITGSFTATIIAKVYVEDGDNTGHILRNKYLIQANTSAINTSNTTVASYTFVDDTALTSSGQVYIKQAGLVAAGSKQTLYLSDVKRIVKIIDTKDANTSPNASMLADASYDITSHYSFDNGQRDSYYDHASITLKPGYAQPIGNILVCLDYYQHSGGDGFFSVNSYTNEDYQEIPQFVSSHGTIYALKDCIDFRPARRNAQSLFIFRYSNSSTNYGMFLPVDLTTFTGDYSFYLGRKDKLVLSKDRSFQIVEGTPAINPIFPSEPDGSLVIAKLTHTPYTGYIPTEAPAGFVSDLAIEKVKHKRYTMQDIATLENRINNVEYYTSLSMLEQKAQNLQISDAYGLNRFKNGILVDDFSSYAAADTISDDYAATINRRERRLTATQQVKNFPLKSSAIAYNMGLASDATLSGLGYNISSDGYTNYFTLPFSTANVITQKVASRTVNLNPFSYATREGTLTLSPNVDNWVDTNYAPALLITDPNLQIFRANAQAINVMSAGDWKTISGTSYSVSSGPVEGHGINWSPFGFVGYEQTTTYTSLQQSRTDVLGPYDKIGNTYALNNNYITDISVLPYIRAQQVVLRSDNLLFNTPVNVRFDNTDVSKYVRKTNIIELNNVSGTFNKDDVIGYYTSGTFTGTARIVGVYKYPGNNTQVRLYVAADGQTSTYTTNGTIQNGYFNSSGVYQSTTASGSLSSNTHFGGRIINSISTTKLQLSPLSDKTDNYYTGNTLYINSGTGAGQSATISAYYGANQTAMLASTVTAANADVYSIGSFSTNEVGSFYGILNIPANTFHTGQRVVRVSNGIDGNLDSATTYAEGTYYAEGLQTTQQSVDFGASPAGAKGVFTSTQYANTFSVVTTYSPWDPVAQTIIISKDNYPNGIFIDSLKLFFRTKPANDNSPVTLSIVGTQNGYPNGETLDHSIVTLTPEQVNVSENPQYLDASTYTKFTFSAPMYIQPGVLYAFMVKSNSNEYTLWSAAGGDTALASTVKNLPTDATPSTVTKIGGAPYVGSMFISQNAQTWTADQNQSLMFVVDRCIFDTTATPSIPFVVPKKLPQRTLIEQSLDYFINANGISSTTDAVSNTDILVDAFNVTTTDFTPTTTGINYTYTSTLTTGSVTAVTPVTPGKFGTASPEDIYLNDGLGERVLVANSGTSFSLYAQLSSSDPSVSPIISDAGLTTYAITWNINNCELSNSLISITSAGAGYNAACTVVTVSAPTGKNGVQALAAANIANGAIQSVYFTQVGSGYITTPTITITDANTAANAILGTGASVIVTGETSAKGGPAVAKYVTKKVALDAGFDSGDLNVYLTAYRPVNTDINVYYKILNRSDTQQFNDSQWQLMTKINSSDSSYSQTRNDLFEYTFAPGSNGTANGYVTYTNTNGQKFTTFSQFAIKIVLTTTDKTAVPFITDMRAIALPSNVNTTV